MADAAHLGILMLDTRFPRIPGDVGNAETWSFPVCYSVVPGATPEAIVQNDPTEFTQAFITAGQALIAQGCRGIATTCGFLALIRPQLAKALAAPVAASALEQCGQIQAMLAPDRRVGILTISHSSFTPSHLSVAAVPENCVIRGVDHTSFAASILGNETHLDVAKAERELVEASKAFVADHPDIGALLLECTNMPPYADAIARATGRPVYSIVTYLNWFHAGLAPACFGHRSLHR